MSCLSWVTFLCLPTSSIASVLCTCIYIPFAHVQEVTNVEYVIISAVAH